MSRCELKHPAASGSITLNVGGYRRQQPVKSRSDVWVGVLVVVVVRGEGGGGEDCRAYARHNDVTELRVFHASNRI